MVVRYFMILLLRLMYVYIIIDYINVMWYIYCMVGCLNWIIDYVYFYIIEFINFVDKVRLMDWKCMVLFVKVFILLSIFWGIN